MTCVNFGLLFKRATPTLTSYPIFRAWTKVFLLLSKLFFFGNSQIFLNFEKQFGFRNKERYTK